MAGQVIVVVGAQYGDEGKGKIVDCESADVVARFNGGANAGHTLVVEDKKCVTHLLPSGIIRSGVENIVGPYVAVDIEVVKEEIVIACRHGSKVVLDNNAPVVLPIHKQIDAGREESTSNSIGTTRRGIGPCYEDFWSRKGIVVGDLLLDRDELLEKILKSNYKEKMLLCASYGYSPLSPNALVDWLMSFDLKNSVEIRDSVELVHGALNKGRSVLFEGAQGVMLDRVFGNNPFVTSSFCTPAAITASFGISKFDRVIGVAKAYLTRVGSGPLYTEMLPEMADVVRARGNEFGATTGRPRRCAWLNLVELEYACRVAGITELVVTKVDTLSCLEKVRACHSYKILGQEISVRDFKPHLYPQGTCVKDYLTFDGWGGLLDGCNNSGDLPKEVLDYISAISNHTGVKVSAIGTGPARDQLIKM